MSVDNRNFLQRELTWPKVTFYFFFHGLHIGMFVLGWYVLRSQLIVVCELTRLYQVEAGDRPTTGGSKYITIFGMAIKRRWSVALRRRRLDSIADVSKYPTLDSTEDAMASVG